MRNSTGQYQIDVTVGGGVTITHDFGQVNHVLETVANASPVNMDNVFKVKILKRISCHTD